MPSTQALSFFFFHFFFHPHENTNTLSHPVNTGHKGLCPPDVFFFFFLHRQHLFSIQIPWCSALTCGETHNCCLSSWKPGVAKLSFIRLSIQVVNIFVFKKKRNWRQSRCHTVHVPLQDDHFISASPNRIEFTECSPFSWGQIADVKCVSRSQLKSRLEVHNE